MPPSALKKLSSDKNARKTASIYLHMPFCVTKCLYCSFNSYAGRDNEIPAYVEALNTQIGTMATHPWCRDRLFTSLYIGGGTPSLCAPELLSDLIKNCLRQFHFGRRPEISLETNPNTLTPQKLSTLLRAGVNRLSIGVQSFSDTILSNIGRSHTADNAVQAFSMARQAGFDNINLDLMYGLPGQSCDTWQQTMEEAVTLAPEHISLYELMLEQGTPLANRVACAEYVLPPEDDIVRMEEITASFLALSGYRQYEISNYAKPGYTCRHNINYWQNRSWLGMGAGAVGSLSGVRVTNTPDPSRYIQLVRKGIAPYSEIECLSRHARFRETIIMGLRMMKGIRLSDLTERFSLNPQEYYGATFDELIFRKIIAISDGFLHLTPKAIPVANQALALLV